MFSCGTCLLKFAQIEGTVRKTYKVFWLKELSGAINWGQFSCGGSCPGCNCNYPGGSCPRSISQIYYWNVSFSWCHGQDLLWITNPSDQQRVWTVNFYHEI